MRAEACRVRQSSGVLDGEAESLEAEAGLGLAGFCARPKAAMLAAVQGRRTSRLKRPRRATPEALGLRRGAPSPQLHLQECRPPARPSELSRVPLHQGPSRSPIPFPFPDGRLRDRHTPDQSLQLSTTSPDSSWIDAHVHINMLSEPLIPAPADAGACPPKGQSPSNSRRLI